MTRLTRTKILGVTVNDTLTFDLHIANVVSRCTQTSYALRTLQAHGLHGQALWDVTRATLVSKLTYASPTWFGFLDGGCKSQCQGVLNRLKRTGYLGGEFADFSELCESADKALFSAVLSNLDHVIHQLLPPIKHTPYLLRPRAHSHELPDACNRLRKNFIYRRLYTNIY